MLTEKQAKEAKATKEKKEDFGNIKRIKDNRMFVNYSDDMMIYKTSISLLFNNCGASNALQMMRIRWLFS